MQNLDTFNWKGAEELERNLRELVNVAGNDRSGKAAVRRSALKALEPFVKTWQSLVPVLSGQYRDSIHTGTRLTRRQAVLARKHGKDQVEVYAGTADPAGQMQEFGTAHHPAQPSGRPAWDQTKGTVFSEFARLIGENLMNAAKRLERKLAKKG